VAPEVAGAATGITRVPVVVDVAGADAAGFVDAHPLAVAAVGVDGRAPGLAAVVGAEELALPAGGGVGDGHVEEVADRIGLDDGVAAPAAGREAAREVPVPAAVVGPGEARLAEVAGDRVELPPADDDAVGRGRVDAHRGLVGRVADDVHARGVDVDL